MAIDDATWVPAVGYADRLSAPPGEAIQFMVSSPSAFSAAVVRLRGPGAKHRTVPSPIAGTYRALVQPIAKGSHLRVDGPFDEFRDGLRITVSIRPTRFGDDPRGIVTWGPELGLFLDPSGHIEFRAGPTRLRACRPVRPFTWCSVVAEADPVAQVAYLTVSADDHVSPEIATAPISPLALEQVANCRIAAVAEDRETSSSCFDGKLAGVKLETFAGDLIASWAFAANPQSTRITDSGPTGRHAISINHPQRAVTGPRWDGDSLDFRVARDQYDAIAFHSDDLADLKWTPTIDLRIPRDWPNGVYALRLDSGSTPSFVPFVVEPGRGRRSAAKVAFLLPTFSYIAYGNERHWWHMPGVASLTEKTLEELVTPMERWASDVGLLSLYDNHTDGTGVCYASARRPFANIQPDYEHGLLRGPHQLSADLHILAWLEARNVCHEILTDNDLHENGLDALRQYAVLLTGTHPEFASAPMLDALRGFVDAGGQLMSLGGNAYCWVTSVHPEEDDVLEVRRGSSGTRPWDSEPGEGHHSTTGEPGGMWRHRGRAPQALLGPGWASFGLGNAMPYTRTAAGHSSEYAWIFAGLSDDEPIGAFGAVLGGAGGFEMDRVDDRLGTPSETVVVATSEGHDPALSNTVVEDLLLTRTPPPPRADMTITQYARGGAVFATGSTCWATSLLHDDGRNPVSTVTWNMLEHMLGRVSEKCDSFRG